MDWISGIQNAINYMEENLTKELSPHEIAKQAYSSSFHFQRVFHILCGFTLGEYIRMRRLTLAGRELIEADARILDIAVKYGYDTQESFSRAFTRFHGVTPLQARNGANLKSFSRLSVKLILDGGKMIDYKIERKEAFKIICKKIHLPCEKELTTSKISDFWLTCKTDGTIQALCKYMSKDNAFHEGIVGASFGRDASDINSPYAIGAFYNQIPVTEKDLVIEEIPAHTYAVFKCVGAMPEAFHQLYHHICSEFFPTSEYQPCGGIDFEVYPSNDLESPDYTCEFWVAVEKK